MTEEHGETGFEIAVIGMAARFSGARHIHEFWENLKNGVESISFFSDEELKASGSSDELLKNPNYVKAKGIIEDKIYFDALFFGYTPREAELMAPQVRIFHECAWTAFEDAGYNPYAYEGLIGLYAGASHDFEWEALCLLSGKTAAFGQYASSQLTNKDFLSTRISYKLNLMGPSISVDTACSTSLVAIHTACQAVINGECDMAAAGGISISSREKNGYMYQEKMILSPDGHCRAFDARAEGMIDGEGVGIVVLKRLAEAVAANDHIYAVIKGSAINNDGVRKVGFTAPSINGQTEVIKTAQQMAEVEPESIGYVEVHGTGTELGDPVEIEALTLAFDSKKKNYCPIGSVKSNLGHLDTAAGAAGFIKTVLALKHKLIPPGLHFEQPNPRIDFENTPFYVNNKLIEWKPQTYPLRAGVSSFGIGGTNAHIILEEAPIEPGDRYRTAGSPGQARVGDALSPQPQPHQLILLSAKTETALERMTENLARYFKTNGFIYNNRESPVKPGITLADAAYTLQVGRKAFQYRRITVASGINDAVEILSSPQSGKLQTHLPEDENPPVIFMFPGQGSQYVNMGKELYQTQRVFHEEMDRCFEVLKPLMKYDIKRILYPEASTRSPGSWQQWKQGQQDSDNLPDLDQTEITQPVLFIFSYALARLIMSRGIKPFAMIGHSIGEYVAACLSGVFSLEDALKLVVFRGQSMQQMPPGAMLSVPLAEHRLKQLLESNHHVELAAVNAPDLCVVTGSQTAIDTFAGQLKQNGCESSRLHTSHAFHSQMMEPVLTEFEEKAKQIKVQAPQNPYISNLTGKWQTAAAVADPHYWAAHIRNTVRFSDGIQELTAQQEESCIFLEIGPGRVLSNLVKKHLTGDKDHTHNGKNMVTINTVRHPKEKVTDEAYLLEKIGELWLHGIPVHWQELHAGQNRHRVSLPTYSFDSLPFPIDLEGLKKKVKVSGQSVESLRKKNDMADWFYIPSWERSQPTAYNHHLEPLPPGTCWLLFIDENTGTFASKLAEKLAKMNREIIKVKVGPAFMKINQREFIINPGQREDYLELFGHLQEMNRTPAAIIHMWAVGIDNHEENQGALPENPGRSRDTGFFSLLNIVHAIVTLNITTRIKLGVVTAYIQEVLGGDLKYPERATILGAVKIIPLEYDNIDCRSIDIELPPPGSSRENQLLLRLIEEFTIESEPGNRVVAYRGHHRWVRKVKPIRLDKSGQVVNRFKKEGVYLITGGFGGMGFTLAKHLGEQFNARLILVGRSFFPDRNDWQTWLENHDEDNPISLVIRELIAIEARGAEIMTASADVSDKTRMKEVILKAKKRFGRINGILHTAGIADYHGIIHKRTRQMTEEILAPKVKGALVLCHLTGDMELDFFVLFSSIGNYIYGSKFGQVGYNAANEFLDAFAYYRSNNAKKTTFTVSIAWDDWQEKGMSVEAVKRRYENRKDNNDRSILSEALTPAEGIEVFNRIMENKLPHIVVATRDLNIWMERTNAVDASTHTPADNPRTNAVMYARPQLKTTYVEPTSDIEKILSTTWENYLGIDRVGIHDNFFDLGANSMDIIQVNIKIKEALKRDIPVINLYTYPTIFSLNRFLNREENDKTSAKNDIEDKKKERKKGKNKLQKRKSRTIGSAKPVKNRTAN